MSSEPTGRRCVFCGGEPVTKEHLWSDWIRKLLPDDAVMSTHTIESHESGTASFPALPFRMTVSAVCHDCNSGWMSDLDGAVKPYIAWMIKGGGRHLHESGLQTIATWAVLKALIFQFVRPKRRFVPDEHYHELYASKTIPPPRFRVWTARTESEMVGFYRSQGLRRERPPGFDTPDFPDGYTITFSVKHLVLKVFGSNETGANISHHQGLIGSIREIWPNNTNFIWPSGPAITTKGLYALAGPFRPAP
jgi:hypothetical protein